MSDRDWLQVGAEVGVYSPGRRGGSPHVAKVERFTKTLVVLDSGDRFPLGTLARREGGTWGWTVRLVPADDPIFQAALAEERVELARARARMACGNWLTGAGGGPALARTAAAALIRYAEIAEGEVQP